MSAASRLELSCLGPNNNRSDIDVQDVFGACNGHTDESCDEASSKEPKYPKDNDPKSGECVDQELKDHFQTISCEKKLKTPQRVDGVEGKPVQLDRNSKTQSPVNNISGRQYNIDTTTASFLAPLDDGSSGKSCPRYSTECGGLSCRKKQKLDVTANVNDIEEPAPLATIGDANSSEKFGCNSSPHEKKRFPRKHVNGNAIVDTCFIEKESKSVQSMINQNLKDHLSTRLESSRGKDSTFEYSNTHTVNEFNFDTDGNLGDSFELKDENAASHFNEDAMDKKCSGWNSDGSSDIDSIDEWINGGSIRDSNIYQTGDIKISENVDKITTIAKINDCNESESDSDIEFLGTCPQSDSAIKDVGLGSNTKLPGDSIYSGSFSENNDSIRSEKKKSESVSYQSQQMESTLLDFASPKRDVCFICGSDLSRLGTVSGRVSHIKRCKAKYGEILGSASIKNDNGLDCEFIESGAEPIEGTTDNPRFSRSVSLSKKQLRNPYDKNRWHGNASIILESKRAAESDNRQQSPENSHIQQNEQPQQTTLNRFFQAPVRSLTDVLMGSARRLKKEKDVSSSTKAFEPSVKARSNKWRSNLKYSNCPSYKKIPGTDFICDGFYYAR